MQAAEDLIIVNTRGKIAPRSPPLLMCWWISFCYCSIIYVHYLPDSREWPSAVIFRVPLWSHL